MVRSVHGGAALGLSHSPPSIVKGLIEGWRYWQVDGGGRLRSLSGDHWKRGEAMRAHCQPLNIKRALAITWAGLGFNGLLLLAIGEHVLAAVMWGIVLMTLSPRRAHAHGCPPSPKPVGCGIYAFKDHNLDGKRHSLNTVYGRVSLWGRVWEMERGWKAEFAYPIAITHRACENCGRMVEIGGICHHDHGGLRDWLRRKMANPTAINQAIMTWAT